MLSGICLVIGLASLLITVPIAIVWALTKMTVYLLIWVYLKLGYFDDRWLHKLAGMPYTPPVHKQRYARPLREWKSKMTDDEGNALPAVFKDRG